MHPNTCPDHPRSRGEYSYGRSGSYAQLGSSPLSRGILLCYPVDNTPVRIIPALAGNTRFILRLAFFISDHPRSRGEYPDSPRVNSHFPGSSPLSRGILTDVDGQPATERIIPALAGNTQQ